MNSPGWFYCKLWRVNFYFFIGWSEKKFSNYCKKHYSYINYDLESANGKCLQLNNGNCVIWTRYKNRSKIGSDLVHEVIHAALFTLSKRGVQVSGTNAEPLTYLVDLILKKALK